MRSRDDQLALGLSLAGNGTHKAGWRHPDAAVGGSLDLQVWSGMANAAERAKIHFLFLADGAAVRIDAEDDDVLSRHGRIDQFEPLTLLAALAMCTTRLGLIATASTSYNEPYTVARKYASLDHISGGRAGWNVVTSWSEAEARNFGRDSSLDREVRYRRAGVFVDVVKGLWDSWSDDAFIRDKASGRYFDPAGMHVLDHDGEFFSVRGPLNIARPPQGHPVIAQAGGSEQGQQLAARTADLIYTAAQDLAQARDFYSGMSARIAAAERDASAVRIMPGLLPIVGETSEEAEAKLADLQALLDPRIGLSLLAHITGPLSVTDLDCPVQEVVRHTDQATAMRNIWLERARRECLTVRQLYELVAITPGHLLVVGTPSQVADTIETWFTARACDGFNIMATHLPGGLHDFLETVVPVLQSRGLFHNEYDGHTLRGTLGLPRPANRIC